jgi:hypothetical protein
MESFIKNISKIQKQLLDEEEARAIIDEIWSCNEPALLIYAAKAIGADNSAISKAKIKVVENHFCGMPYKYIPLYHLFKLASNILMGYTSEGRVGDILEEMKRQLSSYKDIGQDEYSKTMEMIMALEDESVGYVTDTVDHKRYSVYGVKETIGHEMSRIVSGSVREKVDSV